MNQKVENTLFGRSLIINEFNPETTSLGLTRKGIDQLDTIILKNVMNSNYDIFLFKKNDSFEIEKANVSTELYNQVYNLASDWFSLYKMTNSFYPIM